MEDIFELLHGNFSINGHVAMVFVSFLYASVIPYLDILPMIEAGTLEFPNFQAWQWRLLLII